MLNHDLIPMAWLGLAIVLEVIANLLLKYSDGFRKRLIGAASILCVLGAFTALAQAVRGIELSVAYAIWAASAFSPPSPWVGRFSASAWCGAAGSAWRCWCWAWAC